MNNMNEMIIDVREKLEYDKEHIPGAQSIPVSELEGRYSELNKDSPIKIVCNFGGQRSHKAIEILKEKGFQNVEIIEGGMCNWEKNDK